MRVWSCHVCNLQRYKLWIDLSCFVDVGMIDGQYGVWWPMRWKGVSTIQGCYAPCLANL